MFWQNTVWSSKISRVYICGNPSTDFQLFTTHSFTYSRVYNRLEFKTFAFESTIGYVFSEIHHNIALCMTSLNGGQKQLKKLDIIYA